MHKTLINFLSPAHCTLRASLSKSSKLALGFAGCFAAAAMAFAAVAFDPATGVGKVGKGDLQTAWGWNDAKLQASAEAIRFYYVGASAVTVYEAVCTWVTGEGTPGEKTHHVEHTQQAASLLHSEVVRETKTNKRGKVTGFNLMGFALSATQSGGEIPVVGEPCPGNPGHGGVWTSVEVLSSSAMDTGGLYAESEDAPEGASPLLIWSSVTQ
jgi:hypothetical protein